MPTRGTGVSQAAYKFFSACHPRFSSLIRTGTIVPLRCTHPLSQESTAGPRPISRLSWSARHLTERRKRQGRAFPYQSRHIPSRPLPSLSLVSVSSCLYLLCVILPIDCQCQCMVIYLPLSLRRSQARPRGLSASCVPLSTSIRRLRLAMSSQVLAEISISSHNSRRRSLSGSQSISARILHIPRSLAYTGLMSACSACIPSLV